MRMTDSITPSDHYIKSPIYIFYDQIDKFSHFAAISSTLLFIIPPYRQTLRFASLLAHLSPQSYLYK